MLQSIRDRTQGWIAGIIISLLILSFALWGIHSYIGGSAGNNSIAKVNGVEISRNQFSTAYERMRRQMQMQFGSNAALSQQDEANLKNRALQMLIASQVLKQASLNQNFRISLQQIDSFLEGMPEFQVNGEFSLSRFQQVLEATLYNANDFLELIKTSLLIDQPRLGLIFTSFALPNEIVNSVALINQERDIQYAILTPQSVPTQAIQISADQIQDYYNQHSDDFKTPEQVSVEYIELSLKDIMAGMKDKANARQDAEEKFANMREKLASSSYEHPDTLETTAKDLGLSVKSTELFTREKGNNGIDANNKVRNVAFSNDVLVQQNNSDVIQLSDDDVVVIRVKKHLPASLLPVKTVENQIIDKLKAKEIDGKVASLAKEAKDKLQAGDSLEQVANQYHLKWNKVGFVGRHSNKVDTAILDAAFAAKKPVTGKQTFAIAKAGKEYAIIAVSDVRDGELTSDHKEYQVFAEQVQNSQGLMEYELYKQSLMKQAKIVMEN